MAVSSRVAFSCLIWLAGARAYGSPTAVPIEEGRATLPSGLVLQTRADTDLVVRRGKQELQVFHEAAWRGPCPDGNSPKHGSCGIGMSSVVIGDDGMIAVDLEWGGIVNFRPHELDARLDAALASKQAPATAIATLEHALVLDPALWDAAHDLAVRQLATRHGELAAATMVAWLRHGELVAGYQRLVNDAPLKSLLDQPAIAALRAPTPGKLPLKTLRVAWSTTLDAVVEDVEERLNTSGHRGWDEAVELIAFQHPDASLPALTLAKRERATIERLLRDFDFRADPAALYTTQDETDRVDFVLAFDDKLSVRLEIPNTTTGSYVRADDTIRVVRDGNVIAHSRCSLGSLTSAAWLPAARVVVVKDRESGSAGVDGLCVIRLPQ